MKSNGNLLKNPRAPKWANVGYSNQLQMEDDEEK